MELLKLSWFFFFFFQITIPRIYYLISLLTHCDDIWWHRSGSTLPQVIPCCLMAPSHYLIQCWFTTRKVLCHSTKRHSIGNALENDHNNTLEIYALKWKPHPSGANELYILLKVSSHLMVAHSLHCWLKGLWHWQHPMISLLHVK